MNCCPFFTKRYNKMFEFQVLVESLSLYFVVYFFIILFKICGQKQYIHTPIGKYTLPNNSVFIKKRVRKETTTIISSSFSEKISVANLRHMVLLLLRKSKQNGGLRGQS